MDNQLVKIKEAQIEDAQTRRIYGYIKNGWPEIKNLRAEDKIFNQFQGELVILNGLIMKCNRIYIPTNLRRDILEKLHTGHFGIVS